MKDLPTTIIRDNQTFYTCYQQLKTNDIVCGRIRMKPGEEHLLTDLLERGIRLIPSASSQLASRSKTYQARVFSEFMLPGTLPIYDTHALLSASSVYRQNQFTRVILKCDRKNAGMGVHIFNNIEDLYNHASNGSFVFPFVKTPFEFNFNFDYFNSTSAKFILDFCKKLGKLHSDGHNLNVRWHYEEDDEDMLEVGQEMSRMSKIPFAFIEISI